MDSPNPNPNPNTMLPDYIFLSALDAVFWYVITSSLTLTLIPNPYHLTTNPQPPILGVGLHLMFQVLRMSMLMDQGF